MKNITESGEYDLRFSEQGDEHHLLEWFKWPGMSENFPFETQREREIFTKNWASFFRYKCALTAVYKGKVVGMAVLFLMPYKKVSRHGMLYFIVDPRVQRKGVGSSLIKNIIHLGKTRFALERIYLDVYEGSNAKPFLEHCGFTEVLFQEKVVKGANGKYKGRHLMEVSFI